MRLLLLWCLVVGACGCLSSAPLVPVTPANTAQISACETTATDHNALVVGDFALTGGATGLGAIGALESGTQTKTDFAIAAAGAGAVAIVASSLIALTASSFASNQCSGLVGALPSAPLPAASEAPK